MGFDPATAAAVATVAGKVAGDKQLGGVAPVGSTIGASPPAGLLGDLTDKLGLPPTSALSALSGSSPLETALSKVPENPAVIEQKGPPREDFQTPDQTGFDKFFGGLDSTLTSPSKQLGLGLLGQIDPKLAGGGLLLSGLLGLRK